SPDGKPDQRLGGRQPDVLREPRRSKEDDQSVPYSRGRREDNRCHELGSTDELPQDEQEDETERRQDDPGAIAEELIESPARRNPRHARGALQRMALSACSCEMRAHRATPT